jgi:hypothetical protein
VKFHRNFAVPPGVAATSRLIAEKYVQKFIKNLYTHVHGLQSFPRECEDKDMEAMMSHASEKLKKLTCNLSN